MPARLSGAAGTIDLQLHEISVTDSIPKSDHRTAGGARLRYIRGVRIRRASLTFALRTTAEHDSFWTFYEGADSTITRFTFTADVTNHAGDTWSAFFVTEPQFRRFLSGVEIIGFVSVDIEDTPVAL